MDEKIIKEFLKESNHIEQEYGVKEYNDARKAWDWLMKEVPPSGKKKITFDHILEIHRILLSRRDPKIAGKWRTYPVRIGWQIKKYNGQTLLLEDLEHALYFLNENENIPKELRDARTKRAHVEFEDVHPFPDGNGRTGRILYNWHRLRLKLPIHVIHEGEEQYEYYKWFDKPLPWSV